MLPQEEEGGALRVLRGRPLPLIAGNHRLGVENGRPLPGNVPPLLPHQFLEEQNPIVAVPRPEEGDSPLHARPRANETGGPYFWRSVRARGRASRSWPARRRASTVFIARTAAPSSEGKRRAAMSRTCTARPTSPRFSSASQRAVRRTFPPHVPAFPGGE